MIPFESDVSWRSATGHRPRKSDRISNNPITIPRPQPPRGSSKKVRKTHWPAKKTTTLTVMMPANSRNSSAPEPGPNLARKHDRANNMPRLRETAEGAPGKMKTLSRIVVVAAIVCAIYFSTIGTKDFYRLLAMISEVFEAIGNNYLKK
jgi:hypothetical protein